jgi:hypothetical protein
MRLESDGTIYSTLKIEGDQINVPLGPYQWIEVEAKFGE